MTKEKIATNNAPEAVGPYSQAIANSNLIFASGQVPINPQTGKIDSDNITEQAHQALTNLKNVIEAGGSSFDNVVKTTVLLTDLGDFAEVNSIYAEYFNEPYPARACFQVAALPLGAKIEIEAIATK